MIFFFILCIISIQFTTIYAEDIEIGCSILSNKKENCEQENILSQDNIFKLDNLNILEDNHTVKNKKIALKLKGGKKLIKITQKLSSITVLHQNKSFTITREATNTNQSCPPNCIQPINIKDIKTIGTLETLTFIDTLNKNKRMIVIDSRITSSYKKKSIPTAINIPNSILKKGSKHSYVVLKLLGAKKTDTTWFFNHVHTLLIFDNGSLDTQASELILRLIEIGYPQNKILYYYGGISNWINDGLTTI